MSKLRLPREQVKKVLDERLRAGKDVAAKVEVAEKTGGYRDWLQLFATWRDDTITELKAAYEGQDIAREFEFATDSTERSSPRFTFKYRKSTVRSGIWKLESLIKRLSLVQPESSLAEASRARVIEAISLIALTEESITEHVEKARAKIESSDYSGAISSSYTLLEGFSRSCCVATQRPLTKVRAMFENFIASLWKR